MTLQIQAETLGRADQGKKAERRKAKYRSQDLSGAEKQKSEGSPRSISRQAVILQTRRLLFKTGGRLYSPPNLNLVCILRLDFWKQIHNERQLREGVKVADGES